MKRTLRTAITSTAVLAVAGGVLAATVGTAAASFTTPPWQPAPASEQIGTLALYNSSGQQVTGGSDLNHLFDYALASSAGPADPNGIANLEFANPTPGQDPGLWPTSADEASNYPNSGAPAPLDVATNPLVSLDAAGANLNAFKGGVPANSTTGYMGVYEIRAYTSDSGKYWSADVLVSGTSWTEEFGTPVSSTTTAVSGTPASQTQGSSFQVSATVTMADGSTPAGTVAFTSGATSLGSTSTFTGGVAAVTVSAATSAGLALGSDPITATFTPTDTATYTGSNGSGSETITAPATPTTTTLTLGGNYTTAGATDVTFSGGVTPTAAAGSVQFFLDGPGTALTGLTGTGVNGAGDTVAVSGTGGNTYSVAFPAGFAAAPSHSLIAVFTPSAPATFNGSQSSAQNFATSAAAGTSCASEQPNPTSGCTDTQNIKGTIPPGTLSISTPYNGAANALDVGTLALSSDGTYWTNTATFKCITITDATSGGSPFVASALANSLSLVGGTTVGTPPSGAFQTINGENVGLTALGATPATPACPDGTTPVNSYTKTVTSQDNTAATGVVPTDTGSAGLGGSTPHPVLTGSSGGDGTVTYDGTLTLNAPTSTSNGQYTGTIVFTVTD